MTDGARWLLGAVACFAAGIACISFDLEDRRFRCDGTVNTCDEGYACGGDGYCTPIVVVDAAVGDVPLNDGATGEICGNGIDDDNDGALDCGDSECAGTTTCGTGCICPGGNGMPTEVACADGIDNDGDGLTDCLDPDCPRCQGALRCCPDGACRTSC
jgi:hypothetical protein